MTSFFEDHLSLDAVVAFADGEMGLVAFQRAAAHVAQCESCAMEVAEQTSARQRLRAAACPSIPTGLLDALRSIPVALPAPPPPAGISRDQQGRVSRTADRGHPLRGRGFRIGAGAIVAGLAVGALAAAAVSEHAPAPTGPTPGPDTAQVSYPSAPPSGTVVVVAARSAR
jgi:anti-sigma factor RsiW